MKRILITGANRGLGRAIAEVLLSENHAVVALNRSYSKLEGLHQVKCDFRRPYNLDTYIDKAIERLGDLDVCILNAVVRRIEEIQTMTFEQWQESIDVNLTANFVILKRVLPRLITNQGIALIIGSQASDLSFEGGAAYCATKAALKALAGVLIMETRDRKKENDSWKITPPELASLVSKLIDVPPNMMVSEIEVRPTRTLRPDAIGIERMHRI